MAACAGALSVTGAQALSYSFVPFDNGKCQPDCPSVVVASGSITGRESEEFLWFLRQAGQDKKVPRVLVIHSAGGNAYGGLSLGMMLRRSGVTVIVAQASGGRINGQGGLSRGFCGSACVFVLAGGVQRHVPSGSVVAVHGARAVQTEMRDIVSGQTEKIGIQPGEFTEAIAAYYREMGVSPDLARFSDTIPHAGHHVLTAAELSKYRLSTPQ